MWEDKFKLSQDQSIFLMKKLWDKNIYCGMKMENRNVTFPQTQTILEGINVGEVSLSDVDAIRAMRDGWRFVADSFDEPITLPYVQKVNEIVSRTENLAPGHVRTGKVSISSTSYAPPLPDQKEACRRIEEAVSGAGSATQRALDYFLWALPAQLFWDGNKRTGLMIADKLMLQHGAGMINIADNHIERFNTLLNDYYNSFLTTPNPAPLKAFLYEFCIDGIEF
ncbi:MAG: hypothetical protein RR655_07540 [Raoultibacter sp.]